MIRFNFIGFSLSLIFLAVMSQQVISQNAPVTTAGTVVSLTSSAIVPVTVSNFTNIVSFNYMMVFDPAILSVSAVITGPLLGGSVTADWSVPGSVNFGWYTYPGKTLPDNTVLFNITFTKVSSGTSPLTWFDDGYSCVFYDGNWNALNDIPASTYYINGAVTFPPPLITNFTVGNTTPPKNTTIQFTDLTTGNPASWDWSFDRASVVYVNGTNAHSQNPQVQFTDGGLYTVTLVTHNIYFTNTKIKTSYIRAGIHGLWTGNTSADWNTLSNWDNYLVPDGSTDVVIPPVAVFWPVTPGDLQMGTNFRNLTMNGEDSRLTVTGNLIIMP